MSKEKPQVVKCEVGDLVTIPKYSGLFGEDDPIVDSQMADVVFTVSKVFPIPITDYPDFADLYLDLVGSSLPMPYSTNNTQIQLVQS